MLGLRKQNCFSHAIAVLDVTLAYRSLHSTKLKPIKSNTKKQDRSRRCQYIQSFDLFKILILCFDISAILFGKDAPNRLNISIFVISMSISAKIDTLLALFQKLDFGGHYDFFLKRGLPY